MGCSSSREMSKNKGVTKVLENHPQLEGHFTGFVLYDPIKDKVIYDRHGDKYFSPASNTKILTFYTALQILGDSMPAIKYWPTPDGKVFMGTGYPLMMHLDFDGDDELWREIVATEGNMYWCGANYNDERYGEGWMWDDYNYSFQTEKSSMPVFANNLHVKIDSTGKLMIGPWWFGVNGFVDTLRTEEDRLYIKRDELSNQFEVYVPKYTGQEHYRSAPFIASDSLLANLLGIVLEREVRLWDKGIPHHQVRTIYRPMQDTIYRRLLHDSDNYIAEQLLLMCANEIGEQLSTRAAIEYAQTHLFADLESPLVWVDGSGLSRYNMVTPMNMVEVLTKLHRELSEERLLDLFPAGGYSGTIKDYYNSEDGAYVYGKTGTIRHNHNLSGYIKTKKGRLLIFSLMNNHFTGSSKNVKKGMQKLLEHVYERY